MPARDPLTVDVRSLLARGIEPLPAIVAARASLEPGQSLRVVAPFEPRPLFARFQAEGFTVATSRTDDGAYAVTFNPPAGLASGQTLDLDLRHLEPPQPLHHALEAASALRRGQHLLLHTRLRPVHFLEALDDRVYDADSEEAAPAHWVTRVWRI